eukprot:11137811-Karenia_brevis.AAC.1
MSVIMATRRRLRGKTPPLPSQQTQQSAQLPLPQAPDFGDEAQGDSKKKVYLITLPHPVQPTASTGEALVAPSSLSKEMVLQKVQDAFAHP